MKMRLNKIICFGMAAVLAMGLMGCANMMTGEADGSVPFNKEEAMSLPRAKVHATRSWVASSLSDLEKEVELFEGVIVQGYLLNDGMEKKSYDNQLGTLQYGFTEYTLVITNVFRGDLEPDSQVKLIESYYTNEATNEFVIKSNYYPSEPGTEYIFFLYKTGEEDPPQGAYAYLAAEYSRYPVANNSSRIQSYSAEDLDIDPQGPDGLSTYQEIHADIIRAYMN